MTFFNKIKWILGILLVFVLIAITNLIDRNNFVRVRDSVVTIYEDRLVAKELIYKISKSVNKKEIALTTRDSSFFIEKNPKLNSQINNYISRFEQTKLTQEESKIFEDLKSNFNSLFDAEKNKLNSNAENYTTLFALIADINDNLDDLSIIQISEGSKQLAISKKAINTVELFTQIEIYLLVFLAIVIQIIVIYNPKVKK
ncbi:chemotaxis protein [Winogradskyella sp. J14-2]|uniref:MCP four helix bundle domain-containing protein n=1 Tax=Winogradskyella sp. J14-2 TaxID=1936080 RepID=UPI000972BCCC|nr:MCP four helix bundle domain-containing protein [Winogradskyella sp. J14-2]APY08134.1 chemotaxis protein [Winogradskyella sp. J14-2]